jgi:hypothetical protein
MFWSLILQVELHGTGGGKWVGLCSADLMVLGKDEGK